MRAEVGAGFESAVKVFLPDAAIANADSGLTWVKRGLGGPPWMWWVL